MSRSFCSELKVLGVALMSAFALDASAQAYPARPINYFISIGPGSTLEAAHRAMGVEVSRILGQTVVIENKVGAGSRIGLQALMSAPNDGYTIAMTFNGVLVTQAIIDPAFNVQPGKDYAPVIATLSTPFVLAANPSAPFKDLKGMIAYAKANPGKLNASGASPASNSHLSWELLKMMTGAEFTVVNHRAEGPALIDLLNGSVIMAVVSTTVRPHLESGKLFALATTGAKRHGTFPDLPTYDEAGVKGFNVSSLYGIVAPVGTPAPIMARLNDAFNRALTSPDIRKRLLDNGMDPIGGKPEEFTSLIRASLELWRPIILKAGMKLQ